MRRIRDTEEILKEIEENKTEIVEICKRSKNKHKHYYRFSDYRFSDDDISRINELRSHLRNLYLELDRSKYKKWNGGCENEDN